VLLALLLTYVGPIPILMRRQSFVNDDAVIGTTSHKQVRSSFHPPSPYILIQAHLFAGQQPDDGGGSHPLRCAGSIAGALHAHGWRPKQQQHIKGNQADQVGQAAKQRDVQILHAPVVRSGEGCLPDQPSGSEQSRQPQLGPHRCSAIGALQWQVSSGQWRGANQCSLQCNQLQVAHHLWPIRTCSAQLRAPVQPTWPPRWPPSSPGQRAGPRSGRAGRAPQTRPPPRRCRSCLQNCGGARVMAGYSWRGRTC